MAILLEEFDIQKSRTYWSVPKLEYLPKAIWDIDISVSWKVITLINMWEGKFTPWNYPRLTHDSQDSQ